MEESIRKKLLNNREVLEEISRHQWIESEKSGQDIGFDKASADWLQKYAKAWMEYNWQKQKPESASTTARTEKTKASSNNNRRAKSYLDKYSRS